MWQILRSMPNEPDQAWRGDLGFEQGITRYSGDYFHLILLFNQEISNIINTWSRQHLPIIFRFLSIAHLSFGDHGTLSGEWGVTLMKKLQRLELIVYTTPNPHQGPTLLYGPSFCNSNHFLLCYKYIHVSSVLHQKTQDNLAILVMVYYRCYMKLYIKLWVYHYIFIFLKKYSIHFI